MLYGDLRLYREDAGFVEDWQLHKNERYFYNLVPPPKAESISEEFASSGNLNHENIVS